MGKMKGTAWKGNLEYLTNLGGKEGLEKVKAALKPEDLKLIFSQPILPISWVDYGAYIRFMQTADQVLGKGDLNVIRQAAKYNAAKDLRGIYKMFISLVSIKVIFNNASKLWRQYFDDGEMSVETMEPHRGVLKVTGFKDMPLHHEIPQSEFIMECIRISGGKNVKYSHPKCLARKDECCQFEFTWE